MNAKNLLRRNLALTVAKKATSSENALSHERAQKAHLVRKKNLVVRWKLKPRNPDLKVEKRKDQRVRVLKNRGNRRNQYKMGTLMKSSTNLILLVSNGILVIERES